MAAVPVVPVNAFTTPVLVPSNGDVANQAAWLEGAQPLANQTLYLKEHTLGLSSVNQLRRVNLRSGYGTGASTPWDFQHNPGFLPTWKETAITSTTPLTLPLSDVLPHYGKIRELIVELGGSGHAALPAVMPKIQLVRWTSEIGNPNFFTNPPVVVATATDSSANVAAYELVHYLFITGITEIIDLSSYDYSLLFFGESGANSVINQLQIGYAAVSVSG